MNRFALSLLLLLAPLAARAEPQDTDQPADLVAELELLEDVQAGLSLALAACAEEAHCVTALHDQEMQTMREELSSLLEENPMAADDPLRERYQALLDEQEQLQQSVGQVIADIDREELEGVWADQFVIDEIVVGPQVPFPNEDIPLSRFEDLNQPLPIE